MTKHTRGPWYLSTAIGDFGGSYTAIGSAPFGEDILGEFGVTNSANAKLMTAAPDLLAALLLCVAEVEAWMIDQSMEPPSSVAAVSAAKAAIARAEGSSP